MAEETAFYKLVTKCDRFPCFVDNPIVKIKKMEKSTREIKDNIISNGRKKKKIELMTSKPQFYWSITCTMEWESCILKFIWNSTHCLFCQKDLICDVERNFVFDSNRKHISPQDVKKNPWYDLCMIIRRYNLDLIKHRNGEDTNWTFNTIDHKWIENLSLFQTATFEGCCGPNCLDSLKLKSIIS